MGPLRLDAPKIATALMFLVVLFANAKMAITATDLLVLDVEIMMNVRRIMVAVPNSASTYLGHFDANAIQVSHYRETIAAVRMSPPVRTTC